VLLGCGITQRNVDFAFLERDRIPSFLTQTTSCFACVFVMVSKQVFELECLAADPGG
jgi:hypothetical protein